MARRKFVCSAWTVSAVVAALLIAASADAQRRGGDRAKEEVPPPPPGGPIYQPPTPAMNISGVWWTKSYSPKLALVDGGALPLNDKGKDQYARNIAGLKDGSIVDEARHVCVPDGIPRILGNPYPFQIIQTPGQVTFVYELNHVIRPVVMDKPQESAKALEVAPYYSGHSVAHWDGETLVIETAGFNEKTFLDATGAPHSDAMTTVERLRKTGDTTLEDVITITDGEMYTAPFSARFAYDLHPEVRLEDYVCGEKHRDISMVKGVVVPK